MRPPAGEHRYTGPGERRRHSLCCSGPSSPPSPCRRGSSSTSDHHRASSHTRYNCATPLPRLQNCAAHLPRPGRPSAAGGARRRLVWRHRRRLAIVLSYAGSVTAHVRCCCVESRRPPHCASCTVGSRSLSAMRRAYSSLSTAPRAPGAVRARPRSAHRCATPRRRLLCSCERPAAAAVAALGQPLRAGAGTNCGAACGRGARPVRPLAGADHASTTRKRWSIIAREPDSRRHAVPLHQDDLRYSAGRRAEPRANPTTPRGRTLSQAVNPRTAVLLARPSERARRRAFGRRLARPRRPGCALRIARAVGERAGTRYCTVSCAAKPDWSLQP